MYFHISLGKLIGPTSSAFFSNPLPVYRKISSGGMEGCRRTITKMLKEEKYFLKPNTIFQSLA
jgi:hypothetical protein